MTRSRPFGSKRELRQAKVADDGPYCEKCSFQAASRSSRSAGVVVDVWKPFATTIPDDDMAWLPRAMAG